MATAAPLPASAAHDLSASSRLESAGLQKPAHTNVEIPRGDVVAELSYYAPPPDGSAPYNWVEKEEGRPDRNFGDFTTNVRIRDVRGRESEFNLDRDAFAFVQNVPESAEKEFTSDESIQKNYYPEVEKLILENIPGSNRVVIFDHTIRRSIKGAPRAPLRKVHIDQTATAAKTRVVRHLGEDAEKLLQGRYRIINVWRPLNGPVVATPLAYASSQSVKDSDVIPIEHRYPTVTGQTAGVQYSADQEWYYLSGVRNDERVLLECFDSEGLKENSQVKGGRVPHSAFEDPRTPQDAIGRESIEVRALVFGP